MKRTADGCVPMTWRQGRERVRFLQSPHRRERYPVGMQSLIVSIHPIVLAVPGRAVDLELRVTAPTEGSNLPIILLSHGHGPSHFVSSLYGYAPLANAYAARGFAVIQPTHLDANLLGLRETDHPDAPLFPRSRAEDMHRILDGLDAIEAAAPMIAGRLDRARVAVVGHSMGGHTASVLLGAHHPEFRDLAEPRIKAGVILAGVGRGDAVSPYAAEHYPFFRTIDFSTMTAPALVVTGDADASPHLTTAGPAWHADPFVLAPSPKTLLTLFGAKHGLGGVAGYDLAETDDADPARVAVVQELTTAYLRSVLDADSRAWADAQRSLTIGRIDSK
jgi:predicted dienelactone hydrolase